MQTPPFTAIATDELGTSESDEWGRDPIEQSSHEGSLHGLGSGSHTTSSESGSGLGSVDSVAGSRDGWSVAAEVWPGGLGPAPHVGESSLNSDTDQEGFMQAWARAVTHGGSADTRGASVPDDTADSVSTDQEEAFSQGGGVGVPDGTSDSVSAKQGAALSQQSAPSTSQGHMADSQSGSQGQAQAHAQHVGQAENAGSREGDASLQAVRAAVAAAAGPAHGDSAAQALLDQAIETLRRRLAAIENR